MVKKRVVTFERYRYGKRSFLYPGDRFRASGGPSYAGTDEEGNRVWIPMNEAGVFRFIRYCECGASKWIEAYREGQGRTVIYVGNPRWSPNVEGLRLRPHMVRFVSNRRRRKRRGPKGPALLQKTLF